MEVEFDGQGCPCAGFLRLRTIATARPQSSALDGMKPENNDAPGGGER